MDQRTVNMTKTYRMNATEVAAEIVNFVDALGSGLSEEHERKAKQKIAEILERHETPARTTEA